MDDPKIIETEKVDYLMSPDMRPVMTPAITESPGGSSGEQNAITRPEVPKTTNVKDAHLPIAPEKTDNKITITQEKSKLKSIRDALHNLLPGKRGNIAAEVENSNDTKVTNTGSNQDEVSEQKKHSGSIKRKSDERLMKTMRLNAKAFFKDIDAHGMENLDKIPEGTDVIFLETHIQSDAEVQAGITVIGKNFDLAVTNHSSHHSPKEDLLPNLGLRAAGRENFYPIKFIKEGKEGWPVFQPDNFSDMLPVFDKGKAIVMAAHNPVYDSKLPDQPGVGGVMLYQLAEAKNGNVVIVPVAIDIKSQRSVAIGGQFLKAVGDMMPWRRPSADVHIGEPIRLDKIDISSLVSTRSDGHATPTDQDISKARETNEKLREQGGEVMRGLAKLLPPEKQGKWGSSTSPQKTATDVVSQNPA